MILNLPSVGPVSFPDDMPQDQLFAEIDRIGKKYGFEMPSPKLGYGEMFTRGVKRGAMQVGSAFGDIIPAMGAKALGFDEYAQRQMQEAKDTEDEIQRKYPAQYKSIDDVKGPQDWFGFGLETVAEQVPNIATSMIPGGIGAGIAGKLGMAATRGAAIGTYLGSYAQNTPEVFQNIYEKTGKLEPGVGMLFGAAAAALDSVLPARLLAKLTGPMKVGIVEKVLEKSGMDKGLLRSTLAEMMQSTGWEGLTEGAQEAISMAAENFVAGTPQVFDSADWKRIMEASVRGAVAGGAFGTLGGVSEGMRGRAEVNAEKRKEAAAKQREIDAAHAEDRRSWLQAQEAAQQSAARLQGLMDQEMDQGLYSEEPVPPAPPAPPTPFNPDAEQDELASGFYGTAQPVPPTQPAPPTGVAVPEPTVYKKTPLTIDNIPSTLGTTQEELKAFAHAIGLKGNSIPKFLRDLSFAGVPLTDPSFQAELAAFANRTSTPGVAANIEALLKKYPASMEETAPNGQPEPTGSPTSVTPAATVNPDPTEPSVPNAAPDAPTGGSEGTGGTGTPIVTGVDPTAPTASTTDAGKVSEPVAVKEEVTPPEPKLTPEEMIVDFASNYAPKYKQEDQAHHVAARELLGRYDKELEFHEGAQDRYRDAMRRYAMGTLSEEELNRFEQAYEESAPRGLKRSEVDPIARSFGIESEKRDLPHQTLKKIKDVMDRHDFVRDLNMHTNVNLNGMLRDEAKSRGIPFSLLPSRRATHRGTAAFNALRMPQLINKYIWLRDQIENQRLHPLLRESMQGQLAHMESELHISHAQGLGLAKALYEMRDDPRKIGGHLDSLIQAGLREYSSEVEQVLGEAQATMQRMRLPPTEHLDPKPDPNAGNFKNIDALKQRLYLPTFQGAGLDETGIGMAMNGDVNGLLGLLVNTSKNAAVRKVLRKIQSMGLGTKIEVRPVEDGKASYYDPNTDTVVLDPIRGLAEHSVAHEFVHAALVHVLENKQHPLTKDFEQFFHQTKGWLGEAYGGTDLHEFASELVSNPEFQALLKEIRAPRAKENLFSKFMRAVARFFGFSGGAGPTAFDTGLKFVTDAIDISGGVEVNPVDRLFFLNNTGVIRNVAQAMPKLAGNTINSTLNTLSNLRYDGFLKHAFGLFRLDNLITLFGDKLHSLHALADALEMRIGDQEQRIGDVLKTYKQMLEVRRKYSAEVDQLGKLAIDIRLAEVDVLDPNFTPDANQVHDYHRLKAQFDALPQPVQEIYKDARSHYDAALNEYRQFLINNVGPTLAAHIEAEYNKGRRVVSYVPFTRYGDFWIEYEEPGTGDRAVTAFESVRERNHFIERNLTPNGLQYRTYKRLEDIRYTQGRAAPTSTKIGKIMEELRNAGVSQSVMDSVYQQHILLFPANSIMRHFAHAEGTPGMSTDFVRNYADLAITWARKLNNAQYAPRIDEALNGLRAEAENYQNDPTIIAAVENVLSQSDFFHNPTYSNWVHAATAISYFEYIAGNISSALVNIASLPMLVWPALGGRFGFLRTNTVMLDAGKLAMGDWGARGSRYERLYKFMNDHAQLQHTMAREVLEGRRANTADFTGLKARILDGLSIPFAATERYNRAVTAIAAYELALRGDTTHGVNPMTEEEAMRYALDTVKEMHTSGIAATAPRWMQNGPGRVFLTFKSYIWNTAFITARAFHQAFKGENPAVRQAARRQLLGMYGMTMAFAGAKGLPFYGAVSTLATMLQAMFGDDDEPFDLNNELRTFMGELPYKGAFNYITNLEVANRAGLATDLVFRDDPRGVAERGYVASAMLQAFGPAGSVLMNTGNAAKMFQEGHVERAIETIMPSFLRNGMKGMRYMTEGARTLKGDPVTEDVNAYNSMMQAIGFAPADLSSTYERLSSAKSFEREINQRRALLLNRYEMAYEASDSGMMDETLDRISAFNEKIPEKRITSSTLRNTIKRRKEAEQKMIHGLTFDNKMRRRIQDEFFSNE